METQKVTKIERIVFGIVIVFILGFFLFLAMGCLFLIFATQKNILWIPFTLGIIISGYGYIIRKKIIKIFYLDVWWRSLEIKSSNPNNDVSIYTPTIYDQHG